MLARLRLRMQRENPNHAAIGAVSRYLENASEILRAIGEALFGNKQIGLQADRVTLGIALTYQIRAQHGTARAQLFSTQFCRTRSFRWTRCLANLRAAIDLANNATPEGAAAFEKKEQQQPLWLRFSSTIATLHANLNFGSAVFRHALRLSFAMAVGNAIGREFDWRRSYWIPMTIVLVLKPEFAVTFTRGVLRITGTILGLLLATALFHFLPIHVATEMILIGVFTFLMRWIGPANYGVFAVMISALVVLLLTINGVSPKRSDSGARGEYRRWWSAGVAGVPCVANLGAFRGWERQRSGDAARLPQIFFPRSPSLTWKKVPWNGSRSSARGRTGARRGRIWKHR